MSIKLKSALATLSLGAFLTGSIGSEGQLAVDTNPLSPPVNKVPTNLIPRSKRRVISVDEHRKILTVSSQGVALETPKSISLINSVDSIPEYIPYTIISFSETVRKISSKEKRADYFLFEFLENQNPRPNDFYDKLVEYVFNADDEIKNPFTLIFNCAKALRHTTLIIGGNAKNRIPNMHSKIGEIYDLDLLNVSLKLLEYGFTHTQNTKFSNPNDKSRYLDLWEQQKKTTLKHIKEVKAKFQEEITKS